MNPLQKQLSYLGSSIRAWGLREEGMHNHTQQQNILN